MKAPSIGLLCPFDKTSVFLYSFFAFRQDVLGPSCIFLAQHLELPLFHGTLVPLSRKWYLEITTWMLRVFAATYLLLFSGISSGERWEICIVLEREK